MDAADGVTAGSKRPLEAEVDGRAASLSSAQAANANDAQQDAAERDRARLMQQSSGRLPNGKAKNAAPSQSATLMSYELVRHQVQRRLHVEKISTEAIHALVPDVEFRLFQLLQEADRFRRRCRRSKLLPEDINSACRMLNVDPL
jgi:hypothetical protein